MTNKRWKGSQTDTCSEKKIVIRREEKVHYISSKVKLLFNIIFLTQAHLFFVLFFETKKKNGVNRKPLC